MARSPTRLLTGNTAGFLYEGVENVPWDDIQSALKDAAGKGHRGFSDEEMNEIFLATEVYAEELSDQADELLEKDVRNARAELLRGLEHTRLLVSRFLNAAPGDKDQKALDALQMIYGTEDVNIRNALALVGRTSTFLEDHIKGFPEASEDDLNFIEKCSRQPKAVALEAFLWDVIYDSKRFPARSNPGYLKTPQSFEFVRWDIPVGRRSKVFRAFTNALLQEDFSEDQISNAWPKGADRNLEELVEGEVNRGK